eukprot:INCI17141.5.p1 GENE.INCI17141.5~~INCI17141.5.p1  ORF type:complete len:658 (-),score=84.95 INCI17141.5:269-2242(-)
MREPFSVVRHLAQHIDLQASYKLPPPSEWTGCESDDEEETWTPYAICAMLAESRRWFLNRAGGPDAHRGGLQIVSDAVSGVLPFWLLPPSIAVNHIGIQVSDQAFAETASAHAVHILPGNREILNMSVLVSGAPSDDVTAFRKLHGIVVHVLASEEEPAAMSPEALSRTRILATLSSHPVLKTDDLLGRLVGGVNFADPVRVPEDLARFCLKGCHSSSSPAVPTPIQSECWGIAFPEAASLVVPGVNLVATSPTGTGKTLAYLLPAVSIANVGLVGQTAPVPTDWRLRPSVLVLTPTRELCEQVGRVAQELGQYVNVEVAAIFGGVSFEQQKISLLGFQNLRLVVATPGRLLSFIGRIPSSTIERLKSRDSKHKQDIGRNCLAEAKARARQGAILDLSGVVRLVLDESDRMLDIGFANDMHKIVAAVNADASRRDPECSLSTWMFTATWPTSELSGFTREILQAGTLFVAAGHVHHSSREVAQAFEIPPHIHLEFERVSTKGKARVKRLVELLSRGLCETMPSESSNCVSAPAGAAEDEIPAPKDTNNNAASCSGASARTLVFVLYQKEAKDLALMLTEKYGIDAVALYGDMSQRRRQQAVSAFKEGEATILVATDVAARGLDVEGINLVINFSSDLSVASFVHRVGRCGRAGEYGT